MEQVLEKEGERILSKIKEGDVVVAMAIEGDLVSSEQLAKEMGCPLLAQIPLVQSICENGDKGEPSAVNVDSVTGQAFLNLAQAVVTVVNRRNKEQAPTKRVDVKNT